MGVVAGTIPPAHIVLIVLHVTVAETVNIQKATLKQL